jgi:ATP-dependent Lhr-like helicase
LAGRWSLVEDLLSEIADTVRATAWAEQLLDRHGVVTRASVAAEGLPGGFTAVYPVFTRMEETGRVRRGYFIEGMGGAQFALPGAVDRVRSSTADGVHLLAATDPANPYGGVLDWPSDVDGRIGRLAGAYVVLVDGRLAAFLDGKRLLTFDLHEGAFGPVAALIASVGSRHRRFSLETVNGDSIGITPWAAILGEHGFAQAVRGMTMRR